MADAASFNHRAGAQRGRHSVSEFFRYHGLWAPGVRLFRAIGFRAKATIIALTFALPIAVLGWQYLGDKADAIGFSAKERDGVAVVREALPLLQMLQRQRLADAQLAPADPALAEALRENGRASRPCTRPTRRRWARARSMTSWSRPARPAARRPTRRRASPRARRRSWR